MSAAHTKKLIPNKETKSVLATTLKPLDILGTRNPMVSSRNGTISIAEATTVSNCNPLRNAVRI